MEILFKNRKLQKECNTASIATYGKQRAKKLRQRLDELRAAETLADLRYLPAARCHELIGNRAGQLSVDLDHPYRLIFVPANDPIPRKIDGGLDWLQITTISIVGIEDTHE